MALRQAYSSGQPVPFHGMYRTEKVLGGIIPILASDLTAGGQVALFRIPAGFVLAAFGIDSAALDTNGSPTLTASLGDAASNARFLSASTAFRAGAVSIATIAGTRGYRFTADTDLLLTFPAGAATAAAGNVTVFAFGYIDA